MPVIAADRDGPLREILSDIILSVEPATRRQWNLWQQRQGDGPAGRVFSATWGVHLVALQMLALATLATAAHTMGCVIYWFFLLYTQKLSYGSELLALGQDARNTTSDNFPFIDPLRASDHHIPFMG